MGNRQPAFMHYIGDWFKDPELSMCEPATRGIWFDALNRMHERKAGFIKGTPRQLSRLVRCSEEQLIEAVEELRNTGTADIVTFCNKEIMIRSRRKTREFKDLESNRLRVKKHRNSKVEIPVKQNCNDTSSIAVTSSITNTKKREVAQDLVAIFIDECPSLPKPTEITAPRISMLLARFKQLKESLDEWRALCRRIEASDFLAGRTDRPFSCGIDFIIKAGNFNKLIEGNYDNRKNKSGNVGTNAKDQGRQFQNYTPAKTSEKNDYSEA